MAGRPGITIVDVVRACVRLKKERRSIGPLNIRNVLGRGSMTTICRHLRYLALRDVHSGGANDEVGQSSIRRYG